MLSRSSQIAIFVWPWLAVLLERRLYDAKNPSVSSSWFSCGRRRKFEMEKHVVPPDVAISIRNLNKEFHVGRKGRVTAIEDLTLDIPKFGIYVLLGSNG